MLEQSLRSFKLLYCVQGALIASRVNIILGLALDFYTIQQTLKSGGAVSAIKARCEMEVDRIEKQFDDCIAFLLRVFFFRIYSKILTKLLLCDACFTLWPG
jgi:hypothetical protein